LQSEGYISNPCGGGTVVNAHIELHPAMNLEDLKTASPGIEKAIGNYRKRIHATAA